MTRFMKVLGIVGASSGYLMTGACQLDPIGGYSFLASLPSVGSILSIFGMGGA